MNVNKLRGFLAENGYTQKDLASWLGIYEQTISAKMRNKRFTVKEMNIIVTHSKMPIEIAFKIFFDKQTA